MKAISYLFYTAILSAVLFGCKKTDDDATTTTTTAQTTLLSKAVYSAVGTYDYTYDSQNRVKTEAYSGNSLNAATLTSFTGYDSDGKLTSFNVHYPTGASPDYNALVTYNSSGKTDKQFFYSVTGPLTYYTVFTYAGSVTTVKEYTAAGGIILNMEYTTSSDGKNIVQFKNYNSAGTLTSTTVYSNYDVKNSPDGLLPAGYSTAPSNSNNWQNQSRTNNSTGVVTSIIASYQYNADGYPTHRTADNGTTIDYQYVKK